MPRYEFHHRKPPRRRWPVSRLLLILLVVLLVAYPFFEGYHTNVSSTELVFPDLPANLKGLKIVYLTDIQECARFPQARVDGLINTINGLSADLVLFGGDYADDHQDTLAFFANLPALHARLGVFGVLGECDRDGPTADLAPIAKAMTNAGVIPLVNDVEKLKIGQIYLYIAGADDLLTGTPDMDSMAKQVTADDFVIFLGHNPDLLASALKSVGKDGDNHWFDLALFGHTHGGQITLLGLPLIGDLVPTLGRRYLSGWLTENRANILISNGVGTSYFPVRTFAPAQIHLITLKKK